MILSLAVFALVGGFIGLWIAVKKKLAAAEQHMAESFKALSFEVLEKSSRSFLELANATLEKYQEGAKAGLEERHKAIEATLKGLDAHQRALETKREGAYSALSKQIEGMIAAEKELQRETAHLVQALRSPQMRGSWGEVHLRRVVELAGLVNQCDFLEQKSLEDGGKIWRPDLIVRLPGGRHIAVDAKTPLSAYLDAAQTADESIRKQKLLDHATSIRKHIKDLSAKEYWKQLSLAPEYVILFLPAEAFFSAALQSDPALIEVGAGSNVVIATPTTLIAILRAIAFSWKQEKLSESAQEIASIGHELYERAGTVSDHWAKVGKSLGSAVESYNQSVASFESRFLVSLRKLKEAGAITKEIHGPAPVDALARTLKLSDSDISISH